MEKSTIKARGQPAEFSEDRVYRYVLRRRTGFGEKRCLFIMLNPSKADEEKNDPTVRRCMGFASSWGYGVLVVCNIFALRSTDPNVLYQHPDPVGPLNDKHIHGESRSADLVVLAWGNHGAHLKRGTLVWDRLLNNDIVVNTLGLTMIGQPKHPLYLSRVAALTVQKPGGNR